MDLYRADHRDCWNGFVDGARNGHFLFNRNYMEYHGDRFTDASLLVHSEGDLIALFPANRTDDMIISHQGLTFGGLVIGDRLASTSTVLSTMETIAQHYQRAGIREITYKALPHIYHQRPSEEDLYALFRLGARLTRVDATTTIALANRGHVSQRRLRGARKAAKAGLVFRESTAWNEFWAVLTDRLRERHGTAPVHTREEIKLLASRFPKQIRLFTAERENQVLAGAVVYETRCIAHTQYIAASDQGLTQGALDGLFENLIHRYSEQMPYFDFGISTEQKGQFLNEGLISQKEGFGGSTIAHQTFSLSL